MDLEFGRGAGGSLRPKGRKGVAFDMEHRGKRALKDVQGVHRLSQPQQTLVNRANRFEVGHVAKRVHTVPQVRDSSNQL